MGRGEREKERVGREEGGELDFESFQRKSWVRDPGSGKSRVRFNMVV